MIYTIDDSDKIKTGDSVFGDICITSINLQHILAVTVVGVHDMQGVNYKLSLEGAGEKYCPFEFYFEKKETAMHHWQRITDLMKMG